MGTSSVEQRRHLQCGGGCQVQAGLKSQGTPGQNSNMVKSKQYRKVEVHSGLKSKTQCKTQDFWSCQNIPSFSWLEFNENSHRGCFYEWMNV